MKDKMTKLALKVLPWVLVGALAVVAAVVLSGCASSRAAATEGAAAGVGAAAGGPLVGGVVGFFAHLWNDFTAGGGTAEDAVRRAAVELGFFASIGDKIDKALWLALVVCGVLLAVFPRWRAVTLDFLLGLPRAVAALAQRDPATAKEAVKDTALAPWRLVGAVRESKRTRRDPPPPKPADPPATGA